MEEFTFFSWRNYSIFFTHRVELYVSMSLCIHATKSLRLIKRDFRVLQKVTKNVGAQEVFPSILIVIKGDVRRYYRGQDINTCLQDLCLSQNYGVLNHGKAFKRQGRLDPVRIRLSWWGKDDFGHK